MGTTSVTILTFHIKMMFLFVYQAVLQKADEITQ